MTDPSTIAKRAAERKYPHRGHPFDLERQAHISAYMDLLPYVQHKMECIVSMTRSGGLPITGVPSCTCGLNEILNP